MKFNAKFYVKQNMYSHILERNSVTLFSSSTSSSTSYPVQLRYSMVAN